MMWTQDRNLIIWVGNNPSGSGRESLSRGCVANCTFSENSFLGSEMVDKIVRECSVFHPFTSVSRFASCRLVGTVAYCFAGAGPFLFVLCAVMSYLFQLLGGLLGCNSIFFMCAY